MRTTAIHNSYGNTRHRPLLWILFLLLSGYVAYVIVPPYVSYKLLVQEVKAEARNAHIYTDAEIVNRILEKAEGWKIELGPRNLQVIRWSNEIEIIVEYPVEIYFFGRYFRTIYYDIYEKATLSKGPKPL